MLITNKTMRNRYRPYLLPFLFESLGPQCSQCGRRFTADEEGRKKKTAHMDWHFKVNRRITEAEKGAQHRSWLVDKMVSFHSRSLIFFISPLPKYAEKSP